MLYRVVIVAYYLSYMFVLFCAIPRACLVTAFSLVCVIGSRNAFEVVLLCEKHRCVVSCWVLLVPLVRFYVLVPFVCFYLLKVWGTSGVRCGW